MRTPDDRGRQTPRQRLTRMLVLAGVLLVAVVIARGWPKDQSIHYVFGDAAPHVLGIDARWSEGVASNDWIREEAFHFEAGKAPRMVTQELRLPDGDYTVQIDLKGDKGDTVVRKHVTLSGGSTQIDLAFSVPAPQ